jgi:glycosyltransferase involved in cell wall biosynthesis
VQVVCISLVRNEDRFVRRALLNVADFCDRLFVVDHMSTDRTSDILRELGRELDHLEVRRARHSAQSHAMIEGLAGTDTWVLSVDGDELYDPVGLEQFRPRLEDGVYADVFRIRPAGFHCYELDESRRLASGYLSPPSRPVIGLLNFAAIDSWTSVTSQRLHGGDVTFRPGFGWESWRHLGAEYGWEECPFRDLHVGFLRRSSRDPDVTSSTGRPNLAESGAFRRGVLGPFERLARRALGRRQAATRDVPAWKAEKYRRGELATVDASPFLSRE